MQANHRMEVRRGGRNRRPQDCAGNADYAAPVRLATWHINDGTPQRVAAQGVSLERDLEDWIERDPSLVDEGLTMIGRQVNLRGAGRLDLLAVDHARRLVVIEVKPDALYRDVLVQGLDYASALRALPGEQLRSIVTGYLGAERTADFEDLFEPPPREVLVIVVGTGVHSGLERLSDYLGEFGVPIRAVALQSYEIAGHQVLVREAAEVQPNAPQIDQPKQSIESALAQADHAGVGNGIRRVLAVADELGLKQRGYKRSVMITPPSNRNRALITLWPEAHSGRMYCAPEAFEEFFEIPASTVRETLGPLDQGGNRDFTDEVATQVCAGLRSLLGPTE